MGDVDDTRWKLGLPEDVEDRSRYVIGALIFTCLFFAVVLGLLVYIFGGRG